MILKNKLNITNSINLTKEEECLISVNESAKNQMRVLQNNNIEELEILQKDVTENLL